MQAEKQTVTVPSILPQAEQNAYAAAHRILAGNLCPPWVATPGLKRTMIVDSVARIILEEFGGKPYADGK